MHTRDFLHSFSILLSPTSSLWKSSHPPVLGFLNLCCLPLCQIPLSHSLPSAPFFTGGYGLNSPPHSVLHTSPLSGQGLNASSFAPLVHTSCSSSPSCLLYSLSHKTHLYPWYLHNSTPVNIFPSFLLLTGKNSRQCLFQFKRWGLGGLLVGLFVWLVGFCCCCFFKGSFKTRVWEKQRQHLINVPLPPSS